MQENEAARAVSSGLQIAIQIHFASCEHILDSFTLEELCYVRVFLRQ